MDSRESRLVEICKSTIWIVVGTSHFVRFKQIDLKEVPDTVLMIFMWFGEGIRPHKNKTKLVCGGNRLLAAHICQNITFECCLGNRAG